MGSDLAIGVRNARVRSGNWREPQVKLQFALDSPLNFCCLFHAGVEDRHAMEFHWVVVLVASLVSVSPEAARELVAINRKVDPARVCHAD